ncbi:MAG: hypothetical protein JNM33_04855 [Rubrivivax sp.]|nr:hypothetical protein [Rubrivivax sp.]
MPAPLYRKTAAGAEEVRLRRVGLDLRARMLLILCNGELSEAALSDRMSQPVGPLLQRLVDTGLLEAVAPPRQREAAAATAAAPSRLRAALGQLVSGFGASRPDPAASQLPTLFPEEALTPDEHRALMARAWTAFEPLFGPGTGERLAPLAAATEPMPLRRALDELRDAVAIYRGRRAATELMLRLLRD